MLSAEELTLLSSPYPSSISSRPRARRLVEACELAETSLPSTLAPSEAAANGDAKSNAISPNVLVIEMASLIYLGEFVHAKHLWSRSRGIAAAVDAAKKSDPAADSIHQQLELLWNAARYCHLWSNGGIYPLDSSPISTSGSMQVEENEPYSTMAMKALQSCIDSGLQPCATYGAELLEDFRNKVNEGLHRSFGQMKINNFCLRMNVQGDDVSNYGWMVDPSSSEYIIPHPEWEFEYQDVEETDQFVAKMSHEDVMYQMLSNEDRIRHLAQNVMFMEQTKMNA